MTVKTSLKNHWKFLGWLSKRHYRQVVPNNQSNANKLMAYIVVFRGRSSGSLVVSRGFRRSTVRDMKIATVSAGLHRSSTVRFTTTDPVDSRSCETWNSCFPVLAMAARITARTVRLSSRPPRRGQGMAYAAALPLLCQHAPRSAAQQTRLSC